jgi:hypothetical protein
MTLSLFSLFAFLPMSCGLFCNDSCGCGSLPKPRVFVIESFDTKTVDEAGREIPDTQNRPYNRIFRALQIKDITFISALKDEVLYSGGLGLAFACDPAPDASKNTLKLIQIMNEKEFTLDNGTEYGVGENLTSLFGISRFFDSSLVSIDNFIDSGRKLNLYEDLRIGLLGNPGKELNLKFTIRLLFDDGQEFLLTDQLLNVR